MCRGDGLSASAFTQTDFVENGNEPLTLLLHERGSIEARARRIGRAVTRFRSRQIVVDIERRDVGSQEPDVLHGDVLSRGAPQRTREQRYEVLFDVLLAVGKDSAAIHVIAVLDEP